MSIEPSDPQNSAVLQTLLPETLSRLLQQVGADELESQQFAMQGSVMMADVTGFSSLAERLGSEGADGLEELNHALSSYFGRAMDTNMQVPEAQGSRLR